MSYAYMTGLKRFTMKGLVVRRVSNRLCMNMRKTVKAQVRTSLVFQKIATVKHCTIEPTKEESGAN